MRWWKPKPVKTATKAVHSGWKTALSLQSLLKHFILSSVAYFTSEINCKLNFFLYIYFYPGNSIASFDAIERVDDFNSAWQLYRPLVTPERTRTCAHAHMRSHGVSNHEMTSTAETIRGQLDVERFLWLLSLLMCYKHTHTERERDTDYFKYFKFIWKKLKLAS